MLMLADRLRERWHVRAYDGDGLRMSKTVSGTTSYQTWDAASSLPLLIKDGSASYVTGPGGLPLEQISGSTVLYLHHDQIGSTRLVTDGAGSVQATYTYDPWGNPVASTGAIANPFRFAGQYLDGESSLYYLRARYYDPSTGQFISRDPAVASTRQPYAYSYDNPLNLTDPSGLCLEDACVVEGSGLFWVGAGLLGLLGVKVALDAHVGGQHVHVDAPDFGAAARSAWQGLGTIGSACQQGWNALYSSNRTPSSGPPNSTDVFPKGSEGTIRVYGPNGKAQTDYDFGHEHGAGDPHAHDWDWQNPGPKGPRGEGRPITNGDSYP